MDTFVHIAFGAAVGDFVAQKVDEKNFNNSVLDQNKSLTNITKPYLIVTLSGMITGFLSHMIDALPHGDYLVNHGIIIPNKYWPLREFLAALFTFGLIWKLTKGGRRGIIALLSGFMGGFPDIESLLIGIGLLNENNALYPTHNGMLPHSGGGKTIRFLVEYSVLFYSLIWFLRKVPLNLKKRIQ